MDGLEKETQNANAIFGGALVVGNHDSITLFGIHPQNSLKDYSRKVAVLMLNENQRLDTAISGVVASIERFELNARRPISFFCGKRYYHKKILKEYSNVLNYIEETVLYFKLQQAQLVKENKLLEKLFNTISSCEKELGQYIEIGKDVLRAQHQLNSNNLHVASTTIANSESELWFKRLEKRVEDLTISHIFAQQSQMQIKMLYENNMLILDKVVGTISTTFPVWQSQIAIALGIELLETRLIAQKGLATSYNNCTIARNGYKVFDKKECPISLDKVIELNDTLHHALNEMTQLEKDTNLLREKLLDSEHSIKRG